ncbi:unnamed protein product [Periconia digitata]|uniref:Uncharacterized protein n=1 Tax=Periconia digitata TaxID=1303443 RepID=A0A9W4XGR2_9PLEO|nr:unnamed protein product [Periconia digitata]
MQCTSDHAHPLGECVQRNPSLSRSPNRIPSIPSLTETFGLDTEHASPNLSQDHSARSSNFHRNPR